MSDNKTTAAFALWHPQHGIPADTVCAKEEHVWATMIDTPFPSDIKKWTDEGWKIAPVTIVLDGELT